MVTLFDSRRIDKVSTFARGLLPECDEFGNDLPQADYTARDLAWKAQADASAEPSPRFEAVHSPSFVPAYSNLPWVVVDRRTDMLVGSYATQREAQQVAEWEYRQAQLDAMPEYQDWLSQVSDAMPPHEFEDWDLLEMRCVPA
jgi:hypothetical protein